MNSSKQSFDFPKQTRALLSIRPQYAEAILAGRKRYEFRRTIFRRAVDIVVIYATVPTKRLVAEFVVAGIIAKPVEDLWRATRKYAGIDRQAFFRYIFIFCMLWCKN